MAKVKVPKRVGGVKIPKKVRRKAKQALKVAESPVARDFAAAALGALAQRTADKAESGDGDRRPRRSSGVAVRIDSDQLAETLRSAALDGLQRFLQGFEEGLRKVADEDDGKSKRRAANDPPAGSAVG